MYSLPGLGISSRVRIVVSYDKTSKSPDFDPAPALELSAKSLKDQIDNKTLYKVNGVDKDA